MKNGIVLSMNYSTKIWISKYFWWLWKLRGTCGHIDTCRQTKLRDSCTRYEVLHIENDWERVYGLEIQNEQSKTD